MIPLLGTVDEFLRNEGLFARVGAERSRFWAQVRMVAVCGAVYGAVMGSFHGLSGDGWKQIALSAAKVPLLFLATFALCFPSFYVLNALAGLRDDFPRVINAVLGFQSLTAIVLAALAPITELMNLSTASYSFMLFWSGIMFAVATVCGQWRMNSMYRPLIASNSRHRLLAIGWIALYWFVGIQMAWVLRPFVGSPGMPFQLLRPQAWGNAYVEVAELILRVLRR
jgi:uncharacterized membrane protein